MLGIVEKRKASLDKKGYAGAVLIDLPKIFDKINHELLLAKLNVYDFDKKSLEIMMTYLSNQRQRLKINTIFSCWSELLKVFHKAQFWDHFCLIFS